MVATLLGVHVSGATFAFPVPLVYLPPPRSSCFRAPIVCTTLDQALTLSSAHSAARGSESTGDLDDDEGERAKGMGLPTVRGGGKREGAGADLGVALGTVRFLCLECCSRVCERRGQGLFVFGVPAVLGGGTC